MRELAVKKIREALDNVNLPKMDEVLKEAREIASGIKIGRSAFMKKYDVSSELEYKRICIKEKRIMYHAHIGMNTWHETAEALKAIYEFANANNFVLDRAGICLDRRMSLPAAMRKSAPQESGPYLETEDDWYQIGQAAPIQPHMGDFIIGFPASTENAVAALKAGVTTIGNLSQFFAHEAPMWKRRDITAIETVKAIGIMGYLRDKGTLMHSYLDDGLGALFLDCCTSAGWAYLEKYIVETLLGAKLAHCVGGLISDPVKRSGWVFALDEIHEHDCVGSMFYGDTISASSEPEKNRSLCAEYLLWDIMSQLECPTGHAVLPVPFTEALRAPSTDEICEVQLWGREIEKIARRMHPHFDFTAPKKFAKDICERGRTIFSNALDLFRESGVNIKDAVELLYVLKMIGPRVFEYAVNPTEKDEDSHSFAKGRNKVKHIPNDIFTKTLKTVEDWKPFFLRREVSDVIKGKKILLASTDVHEHSLLLLDKLITAAGGKVFNIGAERNPDEVVLESVRNGVEIILISTHNGMALEYARNLLDEMEEQNVVLPVLIGGVLNQNTEQGTVPVDVTNDLKAMGFCVSNDLSLIVVFISI